MLSRKHGLLVATAIAGGRCLEDATAFVQHMGWNDPHAEIIGTLFRNFRGKFNCTKWPLMCQDPINCHQYNAFKSAQWYADGVANSGHSNPQALCMNPWSADYYTKCLVEKDPVGAAHLEYEETKTGKHGHIEHKLEVDASICFLEGLCTEDRINASSSMLDAEAVCDERYDRERWAVADTLKAEKKDRTMTNLGTLTEFENSVEGLRNRAQSTPFSLTSCSKGIFHCDVVYCKETYCKMSYYQEKYGSGLQKYQVDAEKRAQARLAKVKASTPMPNAALIDDLLGP